MAVTRAVIDLRARSIDSHGVLKDIDRALSLLAQHNLDVGGVGNLSSGAASIDNVSRNPDDMESDGPIAVTNHLPQRINGRNRYISRKRASSPSTADEPTSKRRKPNGTTTPSPIVDLPLEVTHRVEIYYESYYDDEAMPPPIIRRLQEGLNCAWNHLPALPSSPLYVYAPKGGYKKPLVGLLEPLEQGSKVDPLRSFLTLPIVGDSSSLEGDHDFTTRHIDLIRAFLDLQDASRANINARLTIHPPNSALLDEGTSQLSEMERNHLLMIVSIDFNVTLIDIEKSWAPTPLVSEAQRRVLHELFPRAPCTIFATPTVSNFISNLQPAPSLPPSVQERHLQPKGLRCELLPFQRRSVYWMLTREGFTLSNTGKVVKMPHMSTISLMWEQVSTKGGATLYLNRLDGEIRRRGEMEEGEPVRGGILAEEVGCGKTVESIGLILLNPPSNRGPWNVSWNELVQVPLHQVKTTLIVTPASLQQQWISELRKHAPGLKVYVFDGWKSMRNIVQTQKAKATSKKGKRKETRPSGKLKLNDVTDFSSDDDTEQMEIDGDGTVISDAWPKMCQDYDVVVTTYSVLSAELDVSKGAVSRPRRESVHYGERSLPRSPLILVEFWRVIMDEVQMAGGVNTAEMVSRIPRVNSFAVSGTPARATVADLLHVLGFLRVPPSLTTSKNWKRLLRPAFFENFNSLFDTRLAVRTCKAQVTHEFQLPTQTRYVVPIDFGPVEKTIYDDILDAALQELHVDIRGVATHSSWEMDLVKLRAALHRLRQACTHPQVGGVGKIDKIVGNRGIKGMEEVLETMREETEDQLAIDLRKMVNLRVRHSQLLTSRPDKDESFTRKILELQLSALRLIEEMVTGAETILKSHRSSGKRMMEEAIAKKKERKKQLSEALKRQEPKEKGKRRSDVTDSDLSGDEDRDDREDAFDYMEGDDRPRNRRQWKWWLKTDNGKSWKHRLTALQGRRRDNLVVIHKVQLLLGDTYYQLKESEDEKKYYEEAENTRSLLLSANEKTAVDSMKSLPGVLARVIERNHEDVEAPTLKNLMIDGPPNPGILTDRIFESEQEIIDILNEQTGFLFSWKERVVDLITQKLIEDVEEGSEVTPYERALEVQQECEAFLTAYQSLLADRREALIAERTFLAATDNRDDKSRKTAAASKAAKAANEDYLVDFEEKTILAALDKGRHALTAALDGRALKTIISQLTDVAERADARKEEIAIAKEEKNRLNRIINVQTKQMDKLDKQLAPIRKTFNERIEYFRQLQTINDSVSAITWEEDSLEEAVINCMDEYSSMEQAVKARQARQRYLNSLRNVDKEEDEEPICVLCKCDFDKGVILGCAHHFCQDCIILWMAKQTSKACPVCRAPIERSAIQPIRFRREETPKQDMQDLKKRQTLENYSVMPEEMRNQILDVDVISDKHGSKIMFLVRHLLWLQQEDPGAKAIVFSAWQAGLSIIANAFTQNDIKYIRIDQARTKKLNPVQEFENDQEIQVLLLHGERDVSGLNITCACRCMVVEPTVNHNFEIQAIARIDRMGQTRATEVYCYSVEGTVERNILDLGARQGLSLYTKDMAQVAMDVRKFQKEKEKVDAPARSKKTGDFIASAEDMFAIMFPHLYEGFSDGTLDEEDAGMDVDSLQRESAAHEWGDAPAAPSTSAL